MGSKSGIGVDVVVPEEVWDCSKTLPTYNEMALFQKSLQCNLWVQVNQGNKVTMKPSQSFSSFLTPFTAWGRGQILPTILSWALMPKGAALNELWITPWLNLSSFCVGTVNLFWGTDYLAFSEHDQSPLLYLKCWHNCSQLCRLQYLYLLCSFWLLNPEHPRPVGAK